MIPVYICDDETQHLKLLKKMITEIITSEELHEIKIVCATKEPMEILDKVSENEPAVYFLDVELGENKISGLELAARIRKINNSASIIMITSYNFALETYRMKIGVTDYIMKVDPDVVAKRIKECLIDIEMSMQEPKTEENIYLNVSGSYEIDVNDIYYINVIPDMKRKAVIHRKTGQTIVTMSLKDIMQQRHISTLLRCDRSHIVNINYINKIDHENNQIVMVTGERIPVSWRCIKDIERKLAFLYST